MSDQTGTNERYEIRITGHLASRWAAAFEGLTLTQHADGTTVLGGTLFQVTISRGPMPGPQ